MLLMPLLPGGTRARLDLTRAQMEVAIAQTNELIAARVAKNAAKARRTARAFREVAERTEEVMKALSPEVIGQPDEGLPFIYRTAEALAFAADLFHAAFQRFMREHGALVEQDAQDRIERFAAWAKALPDQLRPAWLAYLEQFERDLREEAAEQEALAAEWSCTDADGLGDADGI